MTRYLLDTNIVSLLIRGNRAVAQRIRAAPLRALAISAITEGELLFGLARRPEATRLQAAVQEFLRCVDVCPWDSTVASDYARIRAVLQRQGVNLAPLDMLIAAHACSLGAVLVSNDQAFRQIAGLVVEDWTTERG